VGTDPVIRSCPSNVKQLEVLGGQLRLGRHWVWFSLAWLGGVAVQLQQADLWSDWVYGCLAGVSVGMCLLPARLKRLYPSFVSMCTRTALLVSVALGLGFSLAGLHGSFGMRQLLPVALEGEDIGVVGVVAELPKTTSSGVRFVLAVESAEQQGQAVRLPPRIALGWYEHQGSWRTAAASSPGIAGAIKAGQRWQLQVRLKRPHGLMNPHGFDYELYLLEQGVGATGYVREGGFTLVQEKAGFPLQRLRQHVKDAIERQVTDARTAGVLAGLAIGDQSAIERDDWELFRSTGIAHLVSISGLHVTMFAWLAGLLIQAIWRQSSRAPLWCPARSAARWGGLLAAVAYALFAGWGVPAQRTAWMLTTAVLLQSWGRRWPWPLVLVTAAVVVTALDPWALMQPGFWLSFAAVGLLLASDTAADEGVPTDARWASEEQRYGSMSSAHQAPAPLQGLGWRALQGLRQQAILGFRSQLIATVGLAPLSLVFFQQLSLVSLLANVVAIPVVSFVLTPLALAGALWPLLWAPAAGLMEVLSAYLSILAAWPGATWQVPAAPVWAQCAALLGAILVVMPIPWRLRLLSLPLCLPLCWPVVQRPPLGQFDVLAVDVGQGTAVQVRTHKHLLLFDAGPQYSAQSDAGQRVLLPLLQASGEQHIDILMLSHSDTDHVGGASVLLRKMSVGALHSSLPALHPLHLQAQLQGVPSQPCTAGQSWSWDGVDFLVLHPDVDDYQRTLRPNAMSCVLQVRAADGQTRALLTGDIERGQEERLVQTYGYALRSNVLIVPHHGSKTSSTLGFLDRVKADVALVQSGYRNRFGHPAPEVLQRLQSQVGTVWSSPTCGAWLWSSTQAAGQPHGQCWRRQAKRYWHTAADI
jgi:competence protein ComEC